MSRRLPIYLLIDASTSMRGEKIAEVEKGIRILVESLQRDPMALETAYISVITFATEVKQIEPLTDLFHFSIPELTAGGKTYLGRALTFVKECADKEVRKNTPTKKGDWNPLVFILADGGSTDAIVRAAKTFNQRKWGNVIACAIGDGAHVDQLAKITPTVLRIKDNSGAALSEFFRWVSSSVSVASASVGTGTAEKLPPVPKEITII